MFRDYNIMLVRFMPIKRGNIVIFGIHEGLIVKVDMYKYLFKEINKHLFPSMNGNLPAKSILAHGYPSPLLFPTSLIFPKQ